MKKIYLILPLIILIFPSCSSKNKNTTTWHIELPETKILTDINQWAISKYPFIRLRMEPAEDSKIVYYLPIGAIVKVLKKENELRSFDNENNYWYYIDYEGENGWVFGSFIEIFNTQEQALKRSEEMILGGKK